MDLYVFTLIITTLTFILGDGQIDIYSDEAAIQGAIAFAKKKRSQVSRGSLGGGKKGSPSSGLHPDGNFIGVKLTSQGKPERVFLSEE